MAAVFSNGVYLTINSRYTESFMYLFNTLEIKAFVGNEKSTAMPVHVPTCTMLECDRKYPVIIMDKKESSLLDEWKANGWIYGNNLFFAIDYIKYAVLEETLGELADRRIAIWGARRHGEEFLSLIKDTGISVQFRISSNPSRRGSALMGVPVLPPEVLEGEQSGNLFVIVTSDQIDEIEPMLAKAGLERGTGYIHYKSIDYSLPCKIERAITEESITSWRCKDPFRLINVCCDGSLFFCHSPSWTCQPAGNAFDRSFGPIYKSLLHRAMCLSVINGNYAFCHKHLCDMLRDPKMRLEHIREWPESDPMVTNLAFDESCNLHCKSCRNEVYSAKNNKKERLTMYVQEQIMEKTDILIVAANGEVFFSPYYRKILDTLRPNQVRGIWIFTNGLLFDRNLFLDWGDKVNDRIGISVSIDAATAKTYEKLRRGGSFELLWRKLLQMKELRTQGKMRDFSANFVIQSENYLEIGPFVDMAEELCMDSVFFSRINNWGTYSDEEFRQINMYQESGHPTPELQRELDQVLLRDSPVKIYINASDKGRRDLYEVLMND